MQLVLLFTAAICTSAAVLRSGKAFSVNGQIISQRVNISTAEAHYGTADCQCVGIDGVDGDTNVKLASGKVAFPADLGARCEAWDAKKHPDCPGKSWCEQKWCYVDPCKCKSLKALPKPTTYLPDARYQGKPVHYSYATCGGSDSFSSEEMKKTAKDLKATCAVKVDSAKWGEDTCRCIGLEPQSGTTKVAIKGKMEKFPADTGANCQKWEEDRHPDCKGKSPPDWCSEAWCYVDPCSCKLATPPKTSSYLPDANYQGKPIYFSYATCGGEDKGWTTESKTGGKELESVCKAKAAESAAWSPKAIMALALPLLGLIY